MRRVEKKTGSGSDGLSRIGRLRSAQSSIAADGKSASDAGLGSSKRGTRGDEASDETYHCRTSTRVEVKRRKKGCKEKLNQAESAMVREAIAVAVQCGWFGMDCTICQGRAGGLAEEGDECMTVTVVYRSLVELVCILTRR